MINMEVQDVEVVDPLTHAIKHQHVVGDRIADAGIESERLGYTRNEVSCGD